MSLPVVQTPDPIALLLLPSICLEPTEYRAATISTSTTMAAQQSPSGPLPHHHSYAGPGRPPPTAGMPIQQPPPPPQQAKSVSQYLAATNESVWLQLGNLSEVMGELDGATQAYERAMNFNQWSVQAMLAISCILRSKDQFTSAVEYLRQILKVEPSSASGPNTISFVTSRPRTRRQ